MKDTETNSPIAILHEPLFITNFRPNIRRNEKNILRKKKLSVRVYKDKLANSHTA